MKNNMKKATALAAALLLLLSGCSKPEESAVNELPPQEEVITEEVTEPEEVTAEAEEEKIPLRINIDTNQKTYYFPESDQAYLYLQYCDVNVSGDGYDSLKRNLERWSMDRSEGLRSLYASFEETAAEKMEDSDFYGYSLYHTLSASRVDDAVVCLLEETAQYTDANQRILYREGVVFDTKTGKRLALEDLLNDYNVFMAEALERIIYELTDYSEQLHTEYISTVEELWANETGPAWYLDATGIVIVLQEGTVADTEVGTISIHLPYAEFEPYIKESYLPGGSAGVSTLQVNEEVFFELPKTGTQAAMMLSCDWNEDMANASLWLGNQEMPLGEYLVITGAYLVQTGEDVFCLVETDLGSDDYQTTVFRLTDGVIEKVTKVDAAVDPGNINPDQIMMEAWVYMLGTYKGIKTYCFDEQQEFVTEDTEFILTDNSFVLTTTKDLSVTIDDTASVLPAGSHIILNATDNESYVRFTIVETAQTGVLNVVRDEAGYGQILADGVNENECFEILPYAG